MVESDHRTENVSKLLTNTLSFPSNGKDEKLRVISINQGLYEANIGETKCLCEYFNEICNKDGYIGIKQVTCSDMRHHCQHPEVAASFGKVYDDSMKKYERIELYAWLYWITRSKLFVFLRMMRTLETFLF